MALLEKISEVKEDRGEKEGAREVDRIGTKEDSRSPTTSGLALLYYAGCLKTKRQNTLRKSLKSLPDERPVIKTKTKRKGRDRDDVSFDLDEEEEEEDEEMEKERMQEKRKRHIEREKRMRSMREMIVYEARGV